MSIFPTKILLATDGSEEANLALQTATNLATSTGSELHLVYVQAASYVFPTTDWETFGGEGLPTGLDEATKETAKTRVDEQVQKISEDRKSTRLNSSHANISYAVFCLKKKKKLQYYKCIIYNYHRDLLHTS